MAHAFTANHFRIAHASHHAKRTDASTCKTGGFYITPTASETLISSVPLNVTWNTACLNGTTAVDIYLYAPNDTTSAVQTWTNVDYALGTHNVTLNPAWWNHTSPVALQLAIANAQDPEWMATAEFPAGPIFTVTVDTASNGTAASGSADSSTGGTIAVNNVPSAKHTSKGGIAAAVLLPLIALVAAGFAYVWWTRRRRTAKSEAFSEKVDRRMSVASQAWNPMGDAGFSAWRSSFWSKTGPEVGGGVAGTVYGDAAANVAGRGAVMSDANAGVPQARPRPRPSGSISRNGTGVRVSRVSFASDAGSTHGSARRSAIFIDAGQRIEDIVPPMPPLPHMYSQRSQSSDGSGSGMMTPSQAFGPEEVNVDDITARLSAQDLSPTGDDYDLSPALNMMLHDQFTRMQEPHEQEQFVYDADQVDGQYIVTPTQRMNFPVPPTPAYNSKVAAASPSRRQRSSPPSSFHDPASPTRPASPPAGPGSPTQAGHAQSESQSAVPAVQMSPDAMLRAYAERRVASPPAVAQAFPPIAAVALQSGRTLYNPAALPGHGYTQSGEFGDDEDAYAQ